jgi:hypothetical protein
MSATRDDVTKIPLEALVKLRDRAETRLRRINIELEDAAGQKKAEGDSYTNLGNTSTLTAGISQRTNTFGKDKSLWDVVNRIHPEEDFVPNVDEVKTVGSIRDALCLVYEMSFQLKKKDSLAYKEPISGVRMSDEDLQKSRFSNAYSLFAGASLILNRLSKEFDESEKQGFPPLERTTGMFNFNQGQENFIQDMIAKYSHNLKKQIDAKVVKDGPGLINYTYKFFKWVADEALKQKEVYPELVKYVEGDAVNIADEFTLEGFNLPEMKKSTVSEVFVPVKPEEVVGNREAKRKVIRYMDRLCLYDIVAKNNPCMIVGGLSWTNLWDGIPGTGKTTMERMAMTRLREIADIIGLPYGIHAVDQSVKDEFYGKTGKNLLTLLNKVKDPKMLHFILFDDIDMLTSGGRNESSGGADKDIMNIIMQFLDGAFTERLGNAQVYAASNDPKGLDAAIRNRFNDRLMIDGPTTREDMADLMLIKLKKLQKSGLLGVEIGYKPFETQDRYVDGKWSCANDVVRVFDPELKKRFSKATIIDLADYIVELKKQYPSISGRSVNAICDAVKERSADFDLQPEIWTNRSIYLDQPFERKVEVIRDMCTKVTPDMVAYEAKRYADSEARYAANENERAIEKGYNNLIWDRQAHIKALMEDPTTLAEARVAEIALSALTARYAGNFAEIEKRITEGFEKKYGKLKEKA